MKKSIESRDILLSAASGVLIALSFPKFSLSPLAWVGLVPLLIILKDKDKKEAFWFGWLAGLVFFLITINWVTITMHNYGKVPIPVSYAIMFLLALYLGLYTAIFAYLYNMTKEGSPVIRLITGPCIWTALELLRNYFITGFSWALLGYSQYEFLEIIQIADITGVYGVSFLLVIVNIAITEITLSIKKRGRKEKGHYKNLIALAAIPVFLFTVLYIYGYAKLSSNKNDADNQRIKVGLLQGNIDQGVKWDVKFKRETIDIYLNLSKKAKAEGAELIIWPETAAPFFFEQEKEYKKILTDFVRENNIYLLFGSPAIKDYDKLLNRAYLISTNGGILSKYDKMHLVPFGEYVPMTKFLFFINKMVEGIGDFIPGEEYAIMKTDGGRFGVVICYEIIFPELVREFVKKDANFMVTITNDAWFGKSSAPYQHFSMAVFRAVENRVPIVRAANTGISGSIDSYGRIKKTTDIFVETYITDEIEISKNHKKTFYTRNGDIFSYVCTLLVIGFFGWKFIKKRKKS